MDIHQKRNLRFWDSVFLRPFPELITRRIIFIPKAFWRSPVPPGLFYRVVHFGHGNLVVHLNFRVSELDISSYSRQFSELITRPIIFIPTAFWRSWAPPGLFYRVLHLGLGNPVVHFIFDGKEVQTFWLSLALWLTFSDSRPHRQWKQQNTFRFLVCFSAKSEASMVVLHHWFMVYAKRWISTQPL